MNNRNKISIITPCFNAQYFIKETIESVLNQTIFFNNDAELEYIIVDGKSNDDTLGVIEKTISKPQYSKFVQSIKIISEEDFGMYDALAKGLKMMTGNICAYINADDFYYKTAFNVVVEAMKVSSEVRWVTGFSIQYNEKSEIINVNLPYKYRKKFIKQGLYGTKLPFIQQESTFWKTELNKLIDYQELKKFKFAGDYYLWNLFSNQADLYIIQSMLGGFRIRKGQLSENFKLYTKEMGCIAEKAEWGCHIWLDKFIGAMSSNRVKRFLNKNIIYFDNKDSLWKFSK